MALKHIDGFDQYQGQAGQTLLSSLAAAGYSVSSGVAMAAGRKAGQYALELQVGAGTAGSSWSTRNTTVKADLYGVAANTAGRFVAVGDAGTAITSLDGIAWAALILGTNKNLRGIECHSGTYIAVGEGGTILRSTDGQNWSTRTAPNAAANLYDVAWGNNRWLAVGALGTAGVILSSDDDGMTWSNVTENPGTYVNQCVAYGDCWMVGGANGQVLTSDNGLGFTTRSDANNTAAINDLAFSNGTWLTAAGNSIRRSLDKGITWTNAAVSPAGNNVTLQAIAVSDHRWIVTGTGGVMLLSDDTTTWTRPQITSTTSTLLDICVTSGARVGWCTVGSRPTANGVPAIYVSLAPPTTIGRTFTSTANRVVIGFAYRATARGRIMSIAGLLDVDWPAGIQILGTSGASVPIKDTDYYYELVIDKAANTVTLFVNDTQDLTVALPQAGATMTSYAITWQAENGAVARLDDLYLLDSDNTGGSTLTTRLKPISIPIRLPDTDVVADWTPSAPGNHWPLVGLLPPSSASYVSSAESGKQDLYTSAKALPVNAGTSAAPIIAVGVLALAQKSDLDNRQLGLVIGAPGNQKEVIDTTLSISPEYSFAVFETAPGNAAWTAETVQSTPFGIAVRP